MSRSARPTGGSGSLFLIDASNFIYRAFHAIPTNLTTPDGVVINAVHGFVRMVQAMRKEFAPEFIAAVFDTGGQNFRTRMYKEYKANRPPPPDDLVPQFKLVRDATEALGIPRVEVADVEADDVIASYARVAQKEGKRVVIISTDKDLMQLIDAGDDKAGRAPIAMWDSMKNRLIGEDRVEAKFGVKPELLGDLLALMGDSSDNIPGVSGIGAKTAAALLEEHGSLEGVLKAAPSIKQKKRRENLINQADTARLSRKLVALKEDVKLPTPLAKLKDKGSDEATMERFFGPLGFRTLLGGRGVQTTGRMGSRRGGAGAVGAGSELALKPAKEAVKLKVDGDRYRVFLAGDEDALAEYLEALEACERVVVQIAVDGPDSMQAALVGVALAGVPKATQQPPAPAYVPLRHADQASLIDGKTEQIKVDRALALLRPLLQSQKLPKVAHAHKFQALVLEREDIALRSVVMDPQLCSYTLDPARPSHTLESLAGDLLGHSVQAAEKVMGKGKKAVTFDQVALAKARVYACERAEVAALLDRHLEGELARFDDDVGKLFHDIEMPLARVLQRIERRGIAVDTAVLKRQGDELAVLIKDLKQQIDGHAGYAINPDSPKQLQKLLFEDLGLEAGKKTKTGYSTDAATLEQLAVYHPVVNLILEFRSLIKLKGTYLDTLPRMVNPKTGRLHTSFRQAVAQTGRLSSKDPNLQNIPIRTELGRRIREAFVAPRGRVLVTLDYSQIELRVLAHLSQSENLISAFTDGVDVHRRTASEVFDVPESKVTDEQRRVAKAVNFGVIYGQTAYGLGRQLGIPRGKAGSYIKAYFAKIPGVSAYMDELVEQAKQQGYAATIMGRKRRIPELSRRGAARAYGERIARNTPIQGSSADILKKAMIDVERALTAAKFEAHAAMLLTVHDELIFECDEDRVGELVAIAKPAMENAVKLSVPLFVDGGHGQSWAACKG
ncbi:MAG: DNA polymerase I [Myxococcales bacterium]|nr:DNA polymerase I [Myxococcales bacterium]